MVDDNMNYSPRVVVPPPMNVTYLEETGWRTHRLVPSVAQLVVSFALVIVPAVHYGVFGACFGGVTAVGLNWLVYEVRKIRASRNPGNIYWPSPEYAELNRTLIEFTDGVRKHHPELIDYAHSLSEQYRTACDLAWKWERLVICAEDARAIEANTEVEFEEDFLRYTKRMEKILKEAAAEELEEQLNLAMNEDGEKVLERWRKYLAELTIKVELGYNQ